MRILYGSQNFGYANEHSDTDWMEFAYPTWNDILKNKADSHTDILNDGTHIIKKDIRLISPLLYRGYISEMQFMYSTKYIGCEDLEWFIRNRDRLSRMYLYNSFNSTYSVVVTSTFDKKRKVNVKTVTRAWVYLGILKQLLSDCEITYYNEKGLDYRIWAEGLSEKELLDVKESTVMEYKDIGKVFFKLHGKVDHEIRHAANNELLRLLKLRLSNG